jgi:hypothetical protein
MFVDKIRVPSALGGLLAASIAAVTVARQQLKRFNDNEHLKLTLELRRRYDREPIPFAVAWAEQTITAAVASTRCNSAESREFFATYPDGVLPMFDQHIGYVRPVSRLP